MALEIVIRHSGKTRVPSRDHHAGENDIITMDKRHLPNTSFLETEELRALLEISQALHRWTHLDELLLSIIGKTRECMGVETVAVILHDPLKNEFFFRLTEGNPEEGAVKLKEIRFPSNQGIAGSVFKNGKPELILDAAQDPRHFNEVNGQTGFYTKSMVAVPLRTKERMIGVLEVCNKKEGIFKERDVDFLLMIAGNMAMALENARIHEALDKAYRELQLIDEAKDRLIEHAQEENTWLRREVEGRYRFAHIRGNSPQMMELFRICEKVIDSDVSVLIEGETGTGKELIARCLHYNGPRKEKRFVTQNCGGIPDSLLASELFGHTKGAFTGALADKKGLFEVADRGTIFLDEVAEMSAAMQVSLLRTLQEGEIRPLGTHEVKKVDVRVISATNRHLEDDIKKKTFREDLFYRLNVITIRLPPLRERSGDIPVLTDHFVKKFNQRMAKSIRGLSTQALDCLLTYPFPGNVRELENEIERAMVMAGDEGYIQVDHFSERVRAKSKAYGDDVAMQGTLREMIESLEKKVISKTLEEYEGNKARTAKKLGLSRFGLMKKIKRYGF